MPAPTFLPVPDAETSRFLRFSFVHVADGATTNLVGRPLTATGSDDATTNRVAPPASPTSADVAFGILNSLRTSLGLSLREIGSALGVSQTAVAKWMKGQVPSFQKRTQIAVLGRALTEMLAPVPESERHDFLFESVDDSGRTRLDLAAAQAAPSRQPKGRLSALDLLTPSDDDRYVPPPNAKRRLRGAGPLPGKRS